MACPGMQEHAIVSSGSHRQRGDGGVSETCPAPEGLICSQPGLICSQRAAAASARPLPLPTHGLRALSVRSAHGPRWRSTVATRTTSSHAPAAPPTPERPRARSTRREPCLSSGEADGFPATEATGRPRPSPSGPAASQRGVHERPSSKERARAIGSPA
eukprot:scaffold8214_cov121-Isochrysis_galbana.AAC.9